MTFRHLTIDDESDALVSVGIDVADRPMNVLCGTLFEELDRLLDRYTTFADARPLVFRSLKPKGFIVGADLKELAAIRTAAESDAVVGRGLAVFDKLARLPRRTIALIQGSCLGGGLEFALACSHRIAVADDATQLGLPEVRLGLIPGWGGTFRLPRLIGLRPALQIMLAAESVSASVATALGLVSDVIDAPDPAAAVQHCAAGQTAAIPPEAPLSDWWTMLTAVRRFGGEGTSYAACRALVDVVRRCRRRSDAECALDIQQTFAALLMSDDCRKRLDAFFQSRRSG